MAADGRVLDVRHLERVKVDSAVQGFFLDGRYALSLARYESEGEVEKSGSSHARETSKKGFKRAAKAGNELLYKLRYVECADRQHIYRERCMQSSTRRLLMTESQFCSCLRRALSFLRVGQRGVLFCPKENDLHIADVFVEDAEEWKFSEAAGASVQDAEQVKQQGNTAFGDNNLARAVELYSQAHLLLERLKDGKANTALVREQRSVIKCNLAAAYFRMYRWTPALMASEEALLLNPKNTKALYRRAHVRFKLKDWFGALSDFLQLEVLDAANRETYERTRQVVEKECDLHFARMEQEFEKEFLIAMSPSCSLNSGVSQYAIP